MGHEEINLDDLVGHSMILNGSSMSFEHSVALIVVNISTSILGSLGNILVCATVYKTPSLRNNFGLLICSLALADFLVTSVVQPALVAILVRNEIQRNVVPITLNVASEILTIASCSASLGSLWLLSVDRCVCILSPVRYRTLVTGRRVKAAIAFVWLVACSSLVRYFWAFMTPETFRVVGFVCILLCYAVICLCYTLVFWKIRQQAQTRRRMRPGLDKTQVLKMTEKSAVATREETKSVDHSNTVEKKLARTIAIIIGVFTLAWAPLGYVFTSKNDLSPAVVLWATTIGFCNSSVNPVIYCYRSQECRSASKEILSRCCGPIRAKNRVGTTQVILTHLK